MGSTRRLARWKPVAAIALLGLSLTVASVGAAICLVRDVRIRAEAAEMRRPGSRADLEVRLEALAERARSLEGMIEAQQEMCYAAAEMDGSRFGQLLRVSAEAAGVRIRQVRPVAGDTGSEDLIELTIEGEAEALLDWLRLSALRRPEWQMPYLKITRSEVSGVIQAVLRVGYRVEGAP